MMVGSYTLDIYCDNFDGSSVQSARDGVHEHNEFPHQFVGQTRAECIRDARKTGWLIGKKRQLCPKCSGRRR